MDESGTAEGGMNALKTLANLITQRDDRGSSTSARDGSDQASTSGRISDRLPDVDFE